MIAKNYKRTLRSQQLTAVVSVVRAICGCTGIDCSVFVVVRVVRGFYGRGSGGRNRLICERWF